MLKMCEPSLRQQGLFSWTFMSIFLQLKLTFLWAKTYQIPQRAEIDAIYIL